MKISSELRTIISDAYILARAQHHEFVTPEHLLREALNYRSVLSILITSGGNVTGIRDGLDEYLAKNVPFITPVDKTTHGKKTAGAKKTAGEKKSKRKNTKKEDEEYEDTLSFEQPDITVSEEDDPIETLALRSVLERTYNHCMSSEKEVVEFSDVLVSMIDE